MKIQILDSDDQYGDTLKNRDDTKHLEKESEFHEREIKSQFVYDNYTLLMMMIQEH